MGLKVWLPLTKDLHNQGTSQVTVTNNGATYSSTGGKLGGCYYFDGSSARIACSEKNYTYPLSICGWFKPTDFTNGNTQYWLSYNTDVGGTAGHAIGLGTYGGVFSVWYGGTYTNISTNISNNNWYHIAFTIDSNKKATAYLNGIQIWTTTFSQNNPGSKWFTLGARSNSATGAVGDALYFYKGYMNDVRFYDHCLSPQEVAEIAKGLVVHYPLERRGLGQEGLSNFTLNTSNWYMEGLSGSEYNDTIMGHCLKLITNSSDQRMYHNVPAPTWQSGQIYTVSFWAKADQNGRTCDMSRSIADFSPTFTLTTEWKRYYGQITSTATPGGGTLSFRINQSGATVYITNVKLEKGNVVTPYSPGQDDPLCSTLGLNSNIEYDGSGFQNNGTRTGTFTWNNNTPSGGLYPVSTVFNGSDNAIQTPNLTTIISDRFYTISCWVYKSVIGSKNYQTIYGGPGGFELEMRNTSSTDPAFRLHNWGGVTTPYEFNKWYHFCFVHTDTDCKLYLNGELKITGSSAGIPSGNYFVGAWNTSTGQNFDGLMSDFRIYATALSANDIKSLYQNEAFIDTNGTVYGAIR